MADRRSYRPGAGARLAVSWLSHLPAPLHRALPFEQRADLRRRLGRLRPWEDGFDLTPPPSEGASCGPPDFVGVGAALCGTRWWYGLITSHPRVAVRRGQPVGLHYFSHFGLRAFTDDDRVRYHRWFPRERGQLIGEWTPAYAAQPWVAPLLAAAAPEARFLLLVRDPVERFRLGAARVAESKVSNVGAAMAEVIDRGFYGAQLGRLRQLVPPEKVLVLQLERCRDDPREELARTFRFLGLDDAVELPRPAPLLEADAPPLAASVAERLADVYAADARHLAAMAPDLDLERWEALASRLR